MTEEDIHKAAAATTDPVFRAMTMIMEAIAVRAKVDFRELCDDLDLIVESAERQKIGLDMAQVIKIVSTRFRRRDQMVRDAMQNADEAKPRPFPYLAIDNETEPQGQETEHRTRHPERDDR